MATNTKPPIDLRINQSLIVSDSEAYAAFRSLNLARYSTALETGATFYVHVDNRIVPVTTADELLFYDDGTPFELTSAGGKPIFCTVRQLRRYLIVQHQIMTDLDDFATTVFAPVPTKRGVKRYGQ